MTRKIAIVGAGYMAGEHAKAFASLPDVKIVGICGRSRARADALGAKFSVPVFDTIEAMYRATHADAVVVTVNELSMREVCLSCFKYPWLCLLEKPVGIDLAEAEDILAASRRSGTRAYVALNRRSHSSTRQALSELSQDDSPRLISILDQEDIVAARAAGQPEEVITRWMYANAIHVIDYFRVFGRGEIVAIKIDAPWTPHAPGIVVATLKFDSGDIGVYQAVWDGPGPWSVTITNRQVRLEMRPLEKLGIQRRGERRLTEITPDPADIEFKPGLRFQAQQVLLALDGKSTSLATLADATRSMALCADLYGLRTSHGH